MKIINLKATSDLECSCGAWIDHWKKFSGEMIARCAVISCNKATNIDGAHVMKIGASDRKTYICPLCREHNKSNDTLEIPDSFKLVSANKSETCNKK